MATANQPHAFKFPKRSFGKKTPELRSFKPQWFKSHSWLHYDESQDLAFCFVCMVAAKEGKISNAKLDKSFISAGFSNWKDGTTKFRKHECLESHREAVERHINLPKQTCDIGEALSTAYSAEKILRSIRFLARQDLPLRGHDNEQSNFIQVLKLQGESDASILKWLEKKHKKYTCGDIQNEMLQIMALGILREVTQNIRENCFQTSYQTIIQ